MIPKNQKLLKKPLKTLSSPGIIFLQLISLNTYISTNVWKSTVYYSFLSVSNAISIFSGRVPAGTSLYPNKLPPNRIVKHTINQQTLWPKMFLHITGVIIDSTLVYGFQSNSAMLGSSVAKANAAKVSINKLIQSIQTVLKGYLSGAKRTEPTIMITIAQMLITNQN